MPLPAWLGVAATALVLRVVAAAAVPIVAEGASDILPGRDMCISASEVASDDACLAGGTECTLSLRQLRGQSRVAGSLLHDEDVGAASQGGFIDHVSPLQQLSERNAGSSWQDAEERRNMQHGRLEDDLEMLQDASAYRDASDQGSAADGEVESLSDDSQDYDPDEDDLEEEEDEWIAELDRLDAEGGNASALREEDAKQNDSNTARARELLDKLLDPPKCPGKLNRTDVACKHWLLCNQHANMCCANCSLWFSRKAMKHYREGQDWYGPGNLVIPSWPVSGMESIDSPEAARGLDFLWRVAAQHVTSDPGWRWGLLINPSDKRTQNQMHIHFRHLIKGGPRLSVDLNSKLGCVQHRWTDVTHLVSRYKCSRAWAVLKGPEDYRHFSDAYSFATTRLSSDGDGDSGDDGGGGEYPLGPPTVDPRTGRSTLSKVGITIFFSEGCPTSGQILLLSTGCTFEHAIMCKKKCCQNPGPDSCARVVTKK